MNNNLPTLAELHYDVDLAFKNDAFKLLLNQPPVEKWMKQHPMVNSKYLPIDKVEFLLDRIFQEWRIEVVREGVMFQSVYVTVRVHYKNPVTGDWSSHDGVGAKAVQLDSGSIPSDLTKIKPEAVQMALPMAKSYAIKDACDHIGKLFGRDANRKGTIDFTGAYGKQEPKAPKDKSSSRILEVIEACKTREELEKNFRFCDTVESKSAYDERFKVLK